MHRSETDDCLGKTRLTVNIAADGMDTLFPVVPLFQLSPGLKD